MIAVSGAAYQAMRRMRYQCAVKVTWSTDRDVTAGIDVTDRVLTIGSVRRNLGAYLAGYSMDQLVITLDNSDGEIMPKSTTSLIQSGPDRYYGGKLAIQQGIRLDDGTYEYLDVYTGYVESAVHRIGTVELRAKDALSILDNLPCPENYDLGELDSSVELPVLYDVIDDIVTRYTFLTSSDIDRSSADWSHADRLLESGWPISGSIVRSASLGAALRELARSCMATIVGLENGKIGLVSECLPRVFGTDQWGGDTFPDLIDATNAFGFEFARPLEIETTEVLVDYSGSSGGYRDYDDEVTAGLGRLSRRVAMGFVQEGWAANWAGRMIYEMYSGWPRVVSFGMFASGLVVQLNDRMRIKDPFTNEEATYRVVGKTWNPERTSFVAVKGDHESNVFEADVAVAGTDSWGGSEVML